MEDGIVITLNCRDSDSEVPPEFLRHQVRCGVAVAALYNDHLHPSGDRPVLSPHLAGPGPVSSHLAEFFPPSHTLTVQTSAMGGISLDTAVLIAMVVEAMLYGMC